VREAASGNSRETFMADLGFMPIYRTYVSRT
jgi:hypothetical protein